jgi:predicted phage-related endonuclease
MGANELAAKVRELKELEALQAELEAEMEGIKDALKAEMTARGVEEMPVDVFKVRWQTVTSRRFDAKAFQSTHGELYEQYRKPTTSCRFTVTA